MMNAAFAHWKSKLAQRDPKFLEEAVLLIVWSKGVTTNLSFSFKCSFEVRVANEEVNRNGDEKNNEAYDV